MAEPHPKANGEQRKSDGETESLDRVVQQQDTEPDVFLDVPEVKVEEITLEVHELRAHVSVNAKVGNLVQLNVGADAELGELKLTIKGVEAQAQLKVRLQKVYAILARTLTTLDRNPQLLEKVLAPVGEAVGELGRSVGGTVEKTVPQLGQSVGSTVEKTVPALGQSVGDTVEQTGRAVGGTVQNAAGTVGMKGRLTRPFRKAARKVNTWWNGEQARDDAQQQRPQ